MARMPFDPKNKQETAGNFPRLKLEKDEKARIVCVEEQPEFAYVHNLRAPKIVNGRPEMTTKVRRDKTEYETYEMDFIGRPICLGDLGILTDNGVDPKNCPACAMAKQSDMVAAPDRRFAMHVIKYSVRPGTFEPSTPFSVQVVVWSFTDGIYGKLADFQDEWGPLQQHDLYLGPCTDKGFQKFEIAIAQKAAWLEDDDRKKLVALTYKENQMKDLESACGRKTEKSWLLEDLDKISARWKIVNGVAETGTPLRAETASLSEGLADLLAGTSDAPIEPVKATSAAELEGILDTGEPADKGTEKPAASASSADVSSFDDLLASLG